MVYSHLRVALDRDRRQAEITIYAPETGPTTIAEYKNAAFWPLAVARALDDAILHLRFNEPELGTILFRSEGDFNLVAAIDTLLDERNEDWFSSEVRLYWTRVLKRIDATSRSIFTLVELGSCFAGFLAELIFVADRSFMFSGKRTGDERRVALLSLTRLNFGPLPMGNGLSRLATRLLGEPKTLEQAAGQTHDMIDAAEAEELGLVTAIYDEVDWDEEVRLQLEERAGFSPDALTGLEANLRFAGPETMETKIFARLSAWQNWIFQRPNATGDEGALKRYGSGLRPKFDPNRV
jgi:benzoyl-CoA-dihydrodiol lyase